jgi:hypothetical protein
MDSTIKQSSHTLMVKSKSKKLLEIMSYKQVWRLKYLPICHQTINKAKLPKFYIYIYSYSIIITHVIFGFSQISWFFIGSNIKIWPTMTTILDYIWHQLHTLYLKENHSKNIKGKLSFNFPCGLRKLNE